jgi:hypothetical protein
MRGQALEVEITVQPALEVDVYMLDGDVILLGTTAFVQMELRDSVTGELFDPQGSIVAQIFPVADNAPSGSSPAITGIATRVDLEGIPQRGMYVFQFDSTPLVATAPAPQPLQALARISIPYNGGMVLNQKLFSLKSTDDLS